MLKYYYQAIQSIDLSKKMMTTIKSINFFCFFFPDCFFSIPDTFRRFAVVCGCPRRPIGTGVFLNEAESNPFNLN
jgi:hypothetical protein